MVGLFFIFSDSGGFAVVVGVMVYELWRELSLQVPPEELP